MKNRILKGAISVFVGLFVFVGVIFYLEVNHDRFFSTAADQAATVQTLRTIVERQRNFRMQHGCFTSDLNGLPDTASRNRGYTYSVEVDTRTDCVAKYVVLASPSVSMQRRNAPFFAIDENGTVRFEWHRPPNSESRVVQ